MRELSQFRQYIEGTCLRWCNTVFHVQEKLGNCPNISRSSASTVVSRCLLNRMQRHHIKVFSSNRLHCFGRFINNYFLIHEKKIENNCNCCIGCLSGYFSVDWHNFYIYTIASGCLQNVGGRLLPHIYVFDHSEFCEPA
uniref:Uncharacterized protein n=1 Tax=Trichobilharzia regenti TaxID=157069 RepID=A0AA85IVM7_TRIRE|nr:unnamed protein product [Trichobilharzia regenti]